MKQIIIYTKTDEAPGLASVSLLPVITAFTKAADIEMETKDISLAGRIIAGFPEYLTEGQIIPDDLEELNQLVKKPDTNIIKLPNISASIPQLQAAVDELQKKGYRLPDYPEAPVTEEDFIVKAKYDKVKGSAVNPVLREGNSDRRTPPAVKKFAVNHPHSMGEWSPNSKTNTASMEKGDYFGTEKAITTTYKITVQVKLVTEAGNTVILKDALELLPGEILDSAIMSIRELRVFFKEQIQKAKDSNVLFSLHLKSTMMKVSDPIIFGHCVSVFFGDLFNKYKDTFGKLGISPDNGLKDLFARVDTLPVNEKSDIRAAAGECMKNKPALAMVNSKEGITVLHVPSDIIIDASMAAAIRSSGKMWSPDGKLEDTLAVIPDRSYAGVYQNAINFCRENGAFDPRTMGNVSNVGLMAQKAEEYGSHDKTFHIQDSGTVRILDDDGNMLMEQTVEAGDIFRMCQVKDEPVQNWVALAVKRAKATSLPAVFWLDENRAHDTEIIIKVKKYLALHDTKGLDISILPPGEATLFTLKRMKEGKDTISVTGNVLRDYLTDLFPILELGTSSKMLSIVPLMNGGGLFETGAAGSAPRHMEQFAREGHLRWDSLGEFLALTASLEHLGESFHNKKALILSKALDAATEKYLENRKSPSRKVFEIDNRGSHYYLALYWAEALSSQEEDAELKSLFLPLAKKLETSEGVILKELTDVQGSPVDINGYFRPDPETLIRVMRPSRTFNQAIESIC